MTVFSVDWRPCLAVLTVCGFLAAPLGNGLRAQAVNPDPNDAGDSIGAPVQLLPLAPKAATGSQGQPDSAQPASDSAGVTAQPIERQGIEVNPLSGFAPDAIGILTPDQGGLGEDLWRGTSYAEVERWLPRLPDRVTSPALRRLALLLLTTSAPPPARTRVASLAGSGTDDGTVAAQASVGVAGQLLLLRVQRLMAMGEVARAGDLLSAVPSAAVTDPLRRIRSEVALISDRPREACQDIRQGIALNPSGLFWSEGMILCQILDGRIDQAQLGIDLLREQGGAETELFASVAAHLAGADATDLPEGPISAIDFAVLRSLNFPLPEDLPSRISPALYKSVATAPNASLAQRAWAAEEALQRGLIGGPTMAEIYEDFVFSEDQLSAALSQAPELPGTEARALLYQSLRRQQLPVARAEVMRSYFELAASAQRYQMAVEVLLPELSAMPARSDLAWFAETAARAFYSIGRYEQAGSWLAVLQRGAAGDEELAAALTGLWPYVRLAGGPGWPGQPDIAAWTASSAEASVQVAEEDDFGLVSEAGSADAPLDEPEGGQVQPAALLLACFKALAVEDPMTWSDLAEDGAVRPAMDLPLVYALREADSQERLGAQLLYSLILLGGEREGAAPVSHLAPVLAGLTRAGLWQEARALATESLVSRGY